MRIIITEKKTIVLAHFYNLIINGIIRYEYRCQEVSETYSLPTPKKIDKDFFRNMKPSQSIEEISQSEESFIDIKLNIDKKTANILLPALENKLNLLYEGKPLPLTELEQHVKTLQAKHQYRQTAAFKFFNKIGFYPDLAEELSSYLDNSNKIELTCVSKDIAHAAAQDALRTVTNNHLSITNRV